MSAARRLFATHSEAERRGVPVEELTGEQRERARGEGAVSTGSSVTRRELLAGGAAGAAGRWWIISAAA